LTQTSKQTEAQKHSVLFPMFNQYGGF